ncbi:MAG: glycosyltransferase family 2 protein [Thermodesulfobacteriota bacterium]|nr:glycosyltransferase family 2 protein [Thermodesulfobacteriota bacterium]
MTNNPHSTSIATIVVTHNRKELLLNCIEDLLSQTHPCDIIVVDNASTDGTGSNLQDKGYLDDDRIHYFRLGENLGGAGGFHHGLKYAMSHGWEWFWLMDDDAEPERSALKNLVLRAEDSNTVYGSVAMGIKNGTKRLCWTKKVIDTGRLKSINDYERLQDVQEVQNVAFLGFFIHRDLVQAIGLPDPTYFICRDDYEYCERAKKSGARFILVKNSVIGHPVKGISRFRVLGMDIWYRNMPPWKTYYDTRNTILLVKAHYPTLLWRRTIPGMLLQSLCNVFTEKDRPFLLYAYAIGILDGLRNRRGQRFLP